MDWLWVLLVAVRAVSPAPDDQWATQLLELDRVRAEAFATGDASRLDDVYVRGSRGRSEDAATIAAYARRDGKVVGAQLRVLSCEVVDAADNRMRLEVVDQLGPARVVWGDGSSVNLPRDQPSRRTVTIVRTDDGWRIAGTRQLTARR